MDYRADASSDGNRLPPGVCAAPIAAASVAAIFFHNEAVQLLSGGCALQPLAKAAIAKQAGDAG
jgi:hypothetical protein